MTLKPTDPARRGAGRLVVLSAVAALLATAASAWPVAADNSNVALDNLAFKSADGDSFAIAHLEFTNTNLSKDEIVKLLTPDTPVADDRELANKLKADKISIPSIDILGKDGSKIHLAGLAASHVDSGRIEALDVAGLEATGTDKGGPVAVKSGALHLDGVDVAQLLVAADSGDAAKPSRLGGLMLSGLDIVAPDPDSPAGQTIHFAIGSIEVHNTYDGDSLKQGNAKLVGIVVEPSPGSEAGKNSRHPRLFQGRARGGARRQLPGRPEVVRARELHHRRRADGRGRAEGEFHRRRPGAVRRRQRGAHAGFARVRASPRSRSSSATPACSTRRSPTTPSSSRSPPTSCAPNGRRWSAS